MASKRTSKKSISKTLPKTAERIVAISLQHPELGARRLVPLLKKRRISVTATTIQSILCRQGLQTRKMRLAKIKQKTKKLAPAPRRSAVKIPDEVAERICKISLQNPDYGARRITPLLQQEEIFVSASSVYRILKRNNIENRQKRLLKLKARQAPETLPAPKVELPEPVFGPTLIAPIPPDAEAPVPAEEPEPVPEPAVVTTISAERPPLRKAPIKPIKKRVHRIFYPLYLLLFVLIGYLGFHAVQTLQYARMETGAVTVAESAKVGINANIESSTSVQPLEVYRQIWERNLFNTGKVKESNSEKKISLDKIALAKKDLGLELVGTVVADDPKMSRAIIDNRKTREQEAYREGDNAGKVKIKKILRNNVVITTSKGDELLTVEIKESGKRFTPYPTSQQVSSSSSSVQQASGSRRPRARTRSIKLGREEIEASLADIDTLMQQVRLTPYMQGDQAAGFRISNIPADSVLRKMGLRSRDVIIGLDEDNITSPDQAADFFQKLAEGGEVTIRVKRRRRTRQIKLNIE